MRAYDVIHPATAHAMRIHRALGAESAGDLPPMVLLPGIGMSHRYNSRLFETLAPVADVYSFDPPGLGTPAPARQMSIGDYADDIAEALDGEGVTDAVIVGHSMGTQFAVELAVRRPDLAAGIVLMGPVIDDTRRSALVQAGLLLTDSFYESPRTNWITTVDYIRCGPRWYFTELPVMIDYRTEQRIQAIGCSALVIRGENDPIAPREWCEKLARFAPDARLVEVEGEAHVVQYSEANKVAAAIVDFSSALPRRPSGTHRRVFD